MSWGCTPTLGSGEHVVPSELLVQSWGGSQATPGREGWGNRGKRILVLLGAAAV